MFDQRGLTGPIRSHQADPLPRLDRQVQALENLTLSQPTAEPLDPYCLIVQNMAQDTVRRLAPIRRRRYQLDPLASQNRGPFLRREGNIHQTVGAKESQGLRQVDSSGGHILP